MRAIDADEFSKKWEGKIYEGDVRTLLNTAPTIEPQRKKGKWIYKKDLKQFFCSECGFPSLTYDDVYIYSMDLPNYCEDCGADMREGVERRTDDR